ncbi:cytochrome bd-I ubiquinol oxidase subunit 2 apoprotein [Pseudonocardia thermophila]|jgi:cytochrome d oxidase, subunit II (cydB)|uniref:Cytochrome bd-I ubiquinol oxidase subunit 2 apoprotein n=1 Tax=Pseudonocardia thermophila TaxID=1848 RepID=A0A1M6NNT2_PSETH|nr:cytochrome d ubiquinol oxidase subunit II [Pseudonocardia thermophila]SHJ97314.1 cytochrome bd-I ubiquinol oxidase subunit 2 apoprotein [Pseudonocardia thermophila]
MDLPTVWFAAVAVLWTGYLVLEGFDFGVGILAPLVGRDDAGRGAALSSIGPVWDGNEVWLVTAIGVMFAAFSPWYSATLSGFYLPVVLVLLAMIVRGVALHYRSKRPDPAWRARCDTAIAVASAVPPLVWGALFTATLTGVALGADRVVEGGASALLAPLPLLGGIATLALCVLHGATFLALKTGGPIHVRARSAVRWAAPLTAAALAALAVPTGPLAWVLPLLAALAGLAVAAGRDGWAFVATTASTAGLSVLLVASRFPVLITSTTGPDLTVADAVAGPYTLGLLSVIAAVLLPIVLGYQAWTYWVFRKRITATPVSA